MSLSYGWNTTKPSGSAQYLTPGVVRALQKTGAHKVLDVGSGNGVLCNLLHSIGFLVEGCEPSADGYAIASSAYPEVRFHNIGVYDDPAGLSGSFDAVVSTEVVEHLYSPRALPMFAAKVLKPNGHLIISTPYHGYWKNLAISLSGAWDKHHHPLVDGGHIKFWSKKTLTGLLAECGFTVHGFEGAGRTLYLWKSMIVLAQYQGCART